MYEYEALSEMEGEFENEFEEEVELEEEFEGEEFLGTIVRGIGGLFGQGEHEGEFEAESEEEGEAFFGALARLARRALSSPALRRVAQSAAQSALNTAQPQSEYEYEFEEEAEWESETESVLNPIRRVYPDSLMEHFGHAAAAAESEEEAEAFVGALVPLARAVATRALPRLARTAVRSVARPAVRAVTRAVTRPVARPGVRPAVPRPRPSPPRLSGRPGVVRARADRTIRRATPQLVRGVRNMTRTLLRRPATRPLVRVMPTVVQRTINTLGQRAAAGVPVTPNQAVQTLAQQAVRVMGSPQQAVQAYRRSIAMDRRYHAAQPGLNLCPSCRRRVCSQCGSSY